MTAPNTTYDWAVLNSSQLVLDYYICLVNNFAYFNLTAECSNCNQFLLIFRNIASNYGSLKSI
jgi:hypothetical protein